MQIKVKIGTESNDGDGESWERVCLSATVKNYMMMDTINSGPNSQNIMQDTGFNNNINDRWNPFYCLVSGLCVAMGLT